MSNAANEKIYSNIKPDFDPFNHAQFKYPTSLIQPIHGQDIRAINAASQWILSDDANKVFKLPAPFKSGQHAIQDDINRTCYLAGQQAREIQALLTSQKNMLNRLESIRAAREFGQPIPLKFKIWHTTKKGDTEVLINLRKTRKLKMEFFRREETEEGYHSEYSSYRLELDRAYEPVGVIEKILSFGRDCDGPYSSKGVRFCPLELLTAGTNGHPLWQLVEHSERDFYAEAAGY